MDIKEMIEKVGKLDSKHLALIIECGVILAGLEEEESDKLMKLMGLFIEYGIKKGESKQKESVKE